MPPSAAAAEAAAAPPPSARVPMSAVAPLTAVPSKGERVHYSTPSEAIAQHGHAVTGGGSRCARPRGAVSPARARARRPFPRTATKPRRRRRALALFPSARALRKRARARLRPFSSRSAVNPVPAPVSTAVKHSNGVGDKPIVAASPARHDRAPMPSAPANQSNKMPMFEESPSPIDQHRNVTGM